ncbi:hypothetical protein EI94DRAFT_1806751 [Lactarius quietus]|nr:hypothetical protein EI94DRAFT_1806751 [Lactarius quietus]
MTDVQPPDLFLIEPPPKAGQRPAKPSHRAASRLEAGSPSVVRDSGLPPLAGGVPISPWCDLHHSFSMIFLNTDTDIVTATGLAMYKPSTLWPFRPTTSFSNLKSTSRSPTALSASRTLTTFFLLFI